MPDLEAARRLLAAAGRDLRALANMRDERLFPEEIFGLHAQQAVEKSLKAWLACCDRDVPRTHNLRLLLVLLSQAGEDVESEWSFIDLTPFAVQFRYEAFESSDSELDRPAIIKQLSDLFGRVENILNAG